MTQRMTLLHNIMAICIFMVVTIALIPGCTSEPKQVMIPATANANEEVRSLSEDLMMAKQDEIDILSPRNFEKAGDYYGKAQEALEKDKDNRDILKSVGMAKAYLNLANKHAERVRPSVAVVLSAREEAIEAKAPELLSNGFAIADKMLRDETYEAEKRRTSLDAKKRADLQRQYLDLQIDAIKIAKLSPVERSIKAAKKYGARRYAPKTLAIAQSKYEVAKNVIETDRNNSAAIQQASLDARKEAAKLIHVASIAKKNRTSENLALELYGRRMTTRRLNAEVSQTETILKEEREALDEIRTENAILEKKNEFNESFEWAQQQFNPDEAEVYRQGDQLLIRLKNMNYKPGQTELPASAYTTLSKVKNVIARMGAERVKVEGHTDSIGNEILNENLSKDRAEGVAQYLVNGNLIGKSQVETEGLGPEKPIAPNNTPEGRALNRRVDIIVTPGSFENGSSTSTVE